MGDFQELTGNRVGDLNDNGRFDGGDFFGNLLTGGMASVADAAADKKKAKREARERLVAAQLQPDRAIRDPAGPRVRGAIVRGWQTATGIRPRQVSGANVTQTVSKIEAEVGQCMALIKANAASIVAVADTIDTKAEQIALVQSVLVRAFGGPGAYVIQGDEGAMASVSLASDVLDPIATTATTSIFVDDWQDGGDATPAALSFATLATDLTKGGSKRLVREVSATAVAAGGSLVIDPREVVLIMFRYDLAAAVKFNTAGATNAVAYMPLTYELAKVDTRCTTWFTVDSANSNKVTFAVPSDATGSAIVIRGRFGRTRAALSPAFYPTRLAMKFLTPRTLWKQGAGALGVGAVLTYLGIPVNLFGTDTTAV